MLNQYPWWKNLLIVVAIIASIIYALPNIYGSDPAVQISSTRAKFTDDVRAKVTATLKQVGVTPHAFETLPGGGWLLRFDRAEDQLKAKDYLAEALGTDYSVAVNLAANTPGWLAALGAAPMYLGLDLRGGVHFQLQVDMVTAARQEVERVINDIRTSLRSEKLHYLTVGREGGAIEVKFKTADERDKARELIKRQYGVALELKDEERGGEFVVSAKMTDTELRTRRRNALQQNIQALRNRVNELGVSEPIIQQQGEDRIVVQLPGVQDTARAKEILGATATLEFRLVDEEHSVNDALAGRIPPGSALYTDRKARPILLQRRIIVTGEQITDASSGMEQNTGTPAVFISLDSRGAKQMLAVTKEAVGKPMGVVFIETRSETKMVNGQPVRNRVRKEEVINTATIREALSSRFQISGLDSTQEARDLALLLRAGSLAAPMDIVEERTIGPSLGAENISRGFNSTLIGFAAIAIFMAIYYRVFGIVAGVALFVNIMLLVAVLSIMQATLTLPGIAGIALTVGMAIDANVLIFERIREELRNGNTPQAAIHAGYLRAWDTIFDSNITTLIAGVALFLLGSGPVRGFAVTLCIGIVTSMFSAVMVSRAMVNVAYGQRKLAKLPI